MGKKIIVRNYKERDNDKINVKREFMSAKDFRIAVEQHLINAKSNSSTSGERKLRDDEFRISSVGYCSRKLYFNKVDPGGKQLTLAKGLEPEPEDGSNNFHAGTSCHWFFQNFGKDDLDSIEQLVNFDAISFTLSGHCDGEMGNGILDYKSAANISYKIKQGGADKAHRIQANAYAYIMKKQFYAIAYVGKLTYNQWVYEYETDEKMFKEMIEKLEEILLCIQHKDVPMGDPDADWKCGYCDQWLNCIKHDCEVHEGKSFDCRFKATKAKRLDKFVELTKDIENIEAYH